MSGEFLERFTMALSPEAEWMSLVSAGLPCGKEGPMIHSGACFGGLISRFGGGRLLRHYRLPRETRDVVVAGAASGVSAAFGAPVGGVLFAVEEGATHWSPTIMLRAFWCCMVALLALPLVLVLAPGVMASVSCRDA